VPAAPTVIAELALGNTARTMLLPATARSPLAARTFGREMLHDWHIPVVDDVVLVVNELVTNAVIHASGPIMLSLDRRKDAVRIVVSDNSAALPTERRRDPDALGGRGLALVAAMSTDWGVQQRDRGKTVWADVAVDGAFPAAGQNPAAVAVGA
jgi:anti-sigma regulatory factor (Ser/Thr protein kinase)